MIRALPNRIMVICVLLCMAALMTTCAPEPAQAQSPSLTWIDPCDVHRGNPDRAYLVPHPDLEGAYLFTYWNSDSRCSGAFFNTEYMAEDGFTIFVTVEVGYEATDLERITITVPELYTMQPFELIIPDGSAGEMVIFSGLM